MIWIVLAAAAVFGYLLYRMHQRKDARTHHIITLDGFPVTHVPVVFTLDEAQHAVEMLRDTYTRVWAGLNSIYGHFARPMPVDTIGCTMSEVHQEHPHIMWLVGGGKIYLRVHPEMYRWFALELHNVYRFLLHGHSGIYETQGSEDKRHASEAHYWIRNEVWGG